MFRITLRSALVVLTSLFAVGAYADQNGTCTMDGGRKAHYFCPDRYELMLAGGGKEDCSGRCYQSGSAEAITRRTIGKRATATLPDVHFISALVMTASQITASGSKYGEVLGNNRRQAQQSRLEFGAASPVKSRGCFHGIVGKAPRQDRCRFSDDAGEAILPAETLLSPIRVVKQHWARTASRKAGSGAAATAPRSRRHDPRAHA